VKNKELSVGTWWLFIAAGTVAFWVFVIFAASWIVDLIGAA
jgi:hypothetical protein